MRALKRKMLFSYRKGESSEMLVYRILNQLKLNGVIIGFSRMVTNNPIFDFTVQLTNRIVKLQVKSSKRGAKKHRRRNPEIPYIVVSHCKPELMLMSNIELSQTKVWSDLEKRLLFILQGEAS